MWTLGSPHLLFHFADPLLLSGTAQLMQAQPMRSHLAVLYASLPDTLVHTWGSSGNSDVQHVLLMSIHSDS